MSLARSASFLFFDMFLRLVTNIAPLRNFEPKRLTDDKLVPYKWGDELSLVVVLDAAYRAHLVKDLESGGYLFTQTSAFPDMLCV